MVRFAVRKLELIYNLKFNHEPFEFKYNAIVVQTICCSFFHILNDGKRQIELPSWQKSGGEVPEMAQKSVLFPVNDAKSWLVDPLDFIITRDVQMFDLCVHEISVCQLQ